MVGNGCHWTAYKSKIQSKSQFTVHYGYESKVQSPAFTRTQYRLGFGRVKPGLWTGLDCWTGLWTGIWTDTPTDDDHFQLPSSPLRLWRSPSLGASPRLHDLINSQDLLSTIHRISIKTAHVTHWLERYGNSGKKLNCTEIRNIPLLALVCVDGKVVTRWNY